MGGLYGRNALILLPGVVRGMNAARQDRWWKVLATFMAAYAPIVHFTSMTTTTTTMTTTVLRAVQRGH